jgi:hypothetical protein
MNNQHTPAPWVIKKRYLGYAILAPESAPPPEAFAVPGEREAPAVALVYDQAVMPVPPKEQGLPNAHLIAAAPDLLAACQQALTQLALIQAGNSARAIRKGEIDSRPSLQALAAAISKATGQTAESQA